MEDRNSVETRWLVNQSTSGEFSIKTGDLTGFVSDWFEWGPIFCCDWFMGNDQNSLGWFTDWKVMTSQVSIMRKGYCDQKIQKLGMFWQESYEANYPLVGAFKHGFYFPFHIWDSPSHWRTHIFQDGYYTTDQSQFSFFFLETHWVSPCFRRSCSHHFFVTENHQFPNQRHKRASTKMATENPLFMRCVSWFFMVFSLQCTYLVHDFPSQVFHHHALGAKRDHKPCEQQKEEKATWMVRSGCVRRQTCWLMIASGVIQSPNIYIHTYMHACMHTDRQTARHADMQTCRHADMQACRHADMQTCRHADMQTCRHADMQTCRHADMQTCRHADMHADMQTCMQTCRHADMQTCMQTCRHADMQTCRHADMQTCRHADMHACIQTYIHTYIHTFIHTHTYTHTHIHTDTHTHTHRHTYTHTHLHTYLPTYLRTYLPTCMHACIHTFIHTFIHTCIHTYIYIYIHTHIYIYINEYIYI